MASWLKAAEDLFEVVDRKAKRVVGETPDGQPIDGTSVPNGQGTPPKRTRPKRKTQKRASPKETPVTTVENEKDKTAPESSSPKNPITEENKASPITETSSISKDVNDTNKDGPTSDTPSSKDLSINEKKHESNDSEVTNNTVTNVGPSESNSQTEIPLADVSVSDNSTENPFADVIKVTETVQNDLPDIKVVPTATPPKTVVPTPKSVGPTPTPKNVVPEVSSPPGKTDTQIDNGDLSVKPEIDQKKVPEQTDTSAMKIQEQLDEAQGLLKSAVSTGQSKEARLARVCAGLSSRLQEYKSENAQLEELLVAEREFSKSSEARIKQLQKELNSLKKEVNRGESNMSEALSAKNNEIETLINSLDSVKKQAALAEGNLASLQANMDSIMRNRELTETRMMQALREELGAAERRAEEERIAHNATKMASMEREVELEHRAMDSSTALARIQRLADERTAKAADLEHKVALLEAECASLNQELQDMEAKARRGQKKVTEEPNQLIQMQAMQEEVERSRQSQREAENKLSSLEAEMQKTRVEMAAMKRDAEHYSRQEHMELEKRYRELTDLLYYKQTQLETMASEKAAAEFHLEKEMKRNQEAQIEVEKNRITRRGSSYWDEDTDIKTLEPLPLHNRHMVGATIQLQKAAKIIDSGAVRATRFLWRYPTARIILLFYLVFVHLFLMYLLHRLQEQADTFTSREFAASMGLNTNQTLP